MRMKLGFSMFLWATISNIYVSRADDRYRGIYMRIFNESNKEGTLLDVNCYSDRYVLESGTFVVHLN